MSEKKARQKEKAKQYHFTVPPADTDVIRWLEAQDTLSISIRSIIKEAVKRDGFVDIFCKPVLNPGVTAGRPPKIDVSRQENEPVKDENKAVSSAPSVTETPQYDEDEIMNDALKSMMR